MNKIDLDAIRNELLKGFALREYYESCHHIGKQDIYPDDAYNLYRDNSMVYAKVNQIVAGIMAVIEKHINK